MPFGQVVIGPPGSGKTTYCHGMSQYMRAMGRKVAVVNLDPANDVAPYQPDVDISDLVDLSAVMEEFGLGPNGGLLYCMDYLEKNLDWLKTALEPFEKEDAYVLLDLPGQVELFTLQPSFKRVIQCFTDQWGYRLAAVHLVDAHLCTDAPKYISCLTLSLSTMLFLELPHINVLSKVDLLRQYGKLAFRLDFYTEVQDLTYLVHSMGHNPFSQKYRKLSLGLCEVIQEYGLVNFVPLAIEDKEAVAHVLGLIDKANGYVYASLRSSVPYPPEFVYAAAAKGDDKDLWAAYQERYVDTVRERDTAAADTEGQQAGNSSGSAGADKSESEAREKTV